MKTRKLPVLTATVVLSVTAVFLQVPEQASAAVCTKAADANAYCYKQCGNTGGNWALAGCYTACANKMGRICPPERHKDRNPKQTIKTGQDPGKNVGSATGSGVQPVTQGQPGRHPGGGGKR